MYEIIIIVSLAIVFGILLSKWSKTKLPPTQDVSEKSDLSDINFLQKGEGYFKDKKYKEAEKYYLKVASSDPDNPVIYFRLGVIYTRLHNLKDAKEAFKMAVKLNPDNGFYQNNLGLVLYNLKRFKEALLYFENAVDIDDKIASRWINLGLCLGKVGEWQRAKEAYKKALELEPADEKSKELLKIAEEELKKRKR